MCRASARRVRDHHTPCGRLQPRGLRPDVEWAGTPASKAEIVADRTPKEGLRERMDDDPVFYRRFSNLLAQTLEEWRAQRIPDAEYVWRVREVSENVARRPVDEVPELVRSDQIATPHCGLVRERLQAWRGRSRAS